MKWSENEDDFIKFALSQEAKKVEEDKELYGRIREQIYIKGREKDMSNRKIGKKGILIAAIVMALTSGTILAGSISRWERKSFDFYEKYPNQEQLKKDGDFTPDFVKELPGGYTFMMASLEKQELIDQYNKVTDKGNKFTLRYYSKADKAERPVLSFHATDIEDNFHTHERVRVSEVYKKTTLYFYDCIHKYVSNEYTATKEEQKKIDNKELILINIESEELLKMPSETREERVQAVNWVKDGIDYVFMAMDNQQFKEKQLIDMAKAVIDAR